jgi:GMP synthase-like glutamine amidotransferase
LKGYFFIGSQLSIEDEFGYGQMLKSLVINCSLNRKARYQELLRAIRKFSECRAVHFKDLHVGYEFEKDIDAVVLSGSKARIVNPSHRDLFKETIDLIDLLKIPTLGICYGHQLICWSLGCTVASLDEPVKDRFEDVRIIEVDEIFDGFKEHLTVPFAQSHYDYVLKDSLTEAVLVLLADSDSCEVEAVKHKYLPFYGVQFHPERIVIKDQICPQGHRIIENFFSNAVKR